MTSWRLKSGEDRRIRAGHPWVFSNELQVSPKGHDPGAPVTLMDSRGGFLAHGYGNPHSLIAFRAVSFDSKAENCLDLEEIISKVVSAWGHRSLLGYQRSFRLIFGESDSLPGLVIDRYLVEGGFQVFAVQILTAGMEKAVPDVELFIRRIAEDAFDTHLSLVPANKTAIVLRADVNIRKLEGLTVLDPKILQEVPGLDLKNACIELDPVGNDSNSVKMNCDLFEGQKTGFFLDQSWNIDVLGQLAGRNAHLKSPVRILDLCCYVGQWSTKLAQFLKTKGVEVEVEAVDVSATALAFAKTNIERTGARVLIRELDVMEQLGGLPDRYYDIVIADPPAFIKSKKDLPIGKHAYLKFNSQAFRLVKRGGLVVSCSCSGLFPEDELKDVIRKSLQRNSVSARCVGRGGHAADHPTLMSFPEGAYLKMFVNQVSL